MAHSKGLYDEKITILNRKDVTTEHGAKKGCDYQPDGNPVWASVDYLRGRRAMMEASVDVLDAYLVKTAYHERLNEHSRILWQGNTYYIVNLKMSKKRNECQFEMNQQA